ncbi:NfeD family protein [Niallia sp. Krafla_26]|uniref:NfeD family protein n=1 Tax=Niallia sp. Krafla_26 TaxID=3064703 RepID=UPI003D16B371
MYQAMTANLRSLTFAFILFFIPFHVSATVVGADDEIQQTFFSSFIDFLIHPIVIPILLTIGFLGLVVELFTPRFGLAGIVGIIAFLLYFYGHMVAGLAGIGTFLLFVGGIVLLLLELILPGGILGVFGFGAILASFFMSAANFVHIGISLIIAFTISILACMVMIKVFDKKMNFFKKFILTDSTNTESGYVSNQNRTELIGMKGEAFTDLRPSGTVIIGDERIDVVTEGSFITKGTSVKFIKVEGSRIVVREWKYTDHE